MCVCVQESWNLFVPYFRPNWIFHTLIQTWSKIDIPFQTFKISIQLHFMSSATRNGSQLRFVNNVQKGYKNAKHDAEK